MAGQSIPAVVPGNTVADIQLQFRPGAVGIDNLGSCWARFPQSAGASSWIPPRQYGVIVPPPVTLGTLRVDLTQVPSTAYMADLSDLTAAQLTIYEDELVPSGGISLRPFLPTTTLTGRFAAFAFPVAQPAGTYNYTVPPQVGATGCLVYYSLAGQIGHTTTLSVFQNDSSNINIGTITPDVLDTGALAGAGPFTGTLSIYPSLANTANVSADALIGFSPVIRIVATGTVGGFVDVDMLP